jgi:hypothetical protein
MISIIAYNIWIKTFITVEVSQVVVEVLHLLHNLRSSCHIWNSSWVSPLFLNILFDSIPRETCKCIDIIFFITHFQIQNLVTSEWVKVRTCIRLNILYIWCLQYNLDPILFYNFLRVSKSNRLFLWKFNSLFLGDHLFWFCLRVFLSVRKLWRSHIFYVWEIPIFFFL